MSFAIKKYLVVALSVQYAYYIIVLKFGAVYEMGHEPHSVHPLWI